MGIVSLPIYIIFEIPGTMQIFHSSIGKSCSVKDKHSKVVPVLG
jgi:hypothetical protein